MLDATDCAPQQTWLPLDINTLPVKARVLLVLLTRMRSNRTRALSVAPATLRRLLGWSPATLKRALDALAADHRVDVTVTNSGTDGRVLSWRILVRPVSPRRHLNLDNSAIWSGGTLALDSDRQKALLFLLAVLPVLDHGEMDERQAGAAWLAERAGMSYWTFARHRRTALGDSVNPGVLPRGYLTVEDGFREGSNVPGRDIWLLDRSVAWALDSADTHQAEVPEQTLDFDAAAEPVDETPLAPVVPLRQADDSDDVRMLAWCAAGAVAAHDARHLRAEARPSGPATPSEAVIVEATNLLHRYDLQTIMGALSVAWLHPRDYHRNLLRSRGLAYLQDTAVVSELVGHRDFDDMNSIVYACAQRHRFVDAAWYEAWLDALATGFASPAAGRGAGGHRAAHVGPVTPSAEDHLRAAGQLSEA